MTFPDTETVEMLAFLREKRERELAADPVHWYELMAPDGSKTVIECHESYALKLNEERMWRYRHRQQERERAREQARAEFKRTYGHFCSEDLQVPLISDDFLWQRVSRPSYPVAPIEGTARCEHD
jgi:hypothetical protein